MTFGGKPYGEIIAVCTENQRRHKNIKCSQNGQFLNPKAGGTCALWI